MSAKESLREGALQRTREQPVQVGGGVARGKRKLRDHLRDYLWGKLDYGGLQSPGRVWEAHRFK